MGPSRGIPLLLLLGLLLFAGINCNREAGHPDLEPATTKKDSSGLSQLEANSLVENGVAQAAPLPCNTSVQSPAPCEPRDASSFELFSVQEGGALYPSHLETGSVEEVLEKGLALLGASPVHIAFRGSALENSVRCSWRGVARTPGHRESAIRHWLGLEDGESLPSPLEVENRFMFYVNRMAPPFRDAMEENFKTLARGGQTAESKFLTCFVDYRVQESLLGVVPDGVTSQTVAYDGLGEGVSYGLYRRSHAGGRFGDAALLSEGEYRAELNQKIQDAESMFVDIVGSRETVVFLAPMGAHRAIAIEGWRAVAQWDLQTDEDAIVNAVRYGADASDPEYTQTLANLESRITTAAAADDFADDRIANVSGLTQYYRDIGAYGDITPDDGSTATFTPAQPPPAMTCAGGTAVTSPATNRGLVHDCQALLDAKDGLRGTGALNWAADTAISSWDGVTTGGTPSRVTELALASESLSGTIPSELGTLFEMTSLDLSSNSLTGAIPHELGWLFNLTTLKLSGNSLTGCIPVALEGVATNDLSSLNLLYCQPPAPGSLAVTAGETTAAVSWGAVANTSKYGVEYRLRGVGDWTTDADTITSTSHTVGDLACESDYQFRVSAHGSGTTYAAEWSEGSAAVNDTTTACASPVFDEESYAFEVSEDVAVSADVGIVSATDPNADTVTYSITEGNNGGKFVIGSATGAITVVAGLDYEGTPAYSLTVQARDGGGNTDTATVEITVTDVAEDPHPAPGGLAASLAEGTFTVTWTAMTGAARYQVQQMIEGSGEDWADVEITTGTSADYTPEGGPACGSTYRFQVRAYGDGVVYTEVWGAYTEPATHSTEACNQAPEFDNDPYGFQIPENTSVGGTVGTVSATDPDSQDTLTYSITAGNEGGKFDIDGTTGAITVAGTLNYETVSSYALTVEVSDGMGGSDTAAVGITVTDVAEDAHPAPEGLDVSLSGGTFTVTWTAMTGAARYQVQQMIEGSGEDWTDVEVTTGTSADYTPEGAPACGSTYRFQVRAYGDGVVYTEVWGAYTEPATHTTEACNQAPEFDIDPYVFQVPEDTSAGGTVGTVSATDPDSQDTLTYSITGGNEGDKFDIDGGSGEITVAGALDYETEPSYTLTVQVDDDRGGTDTATAEVTVTDVAEDPPPAPQGLSASLSDGTFTVTWDAVNGANRYEAQHRVQGSGDEWTSLPAATGTSSEYSPSGGPACGTTYEFRVRAYGDQVVYAPVWGEYTEPATVDTPACNQPPEFGAESYDFQISDGTADGGTVGSVAATDPDAGDTLNYSITGGNEAVKFDIDGTTGAITVAGTLNYETVSSYALTVEADDANGGTATTRVNISLTMAECSNGTAVPQPETWLGLVRDCSILLAARDTLAGEGSLNWSADTSMAQWQGVTLDLRPVMRVWMLLLTDQGLTGTIPASLSGLDYLSRLDLDDNDLTGPIPAELGDLTNLKHLYLFENRLSGGIPAELGKLTLLRYLFLYDNRLSGGIPAELGQLTNLRELLLDNNRLDGAIPAELGDMTLLQDLYLRDNLLTGSIPSDLGDLDNLTGLYLEGNGFTGCIPAGLRDVEDNDLDTLGLTDCS